MSNIFALYTLAFASLVSSALASLYPISPVSNTVFYAGQTANISWKNDHRYPSLKELGKMRVELWAGENNVAVLGDDVEPTSYSYFPTMPNLTYLGEERLFGIHFIPHNAKYKTMYTAPFSIQQPTPDMLRKAAAGYTLLTLILPSETVVSTIERQPTPYVSATVTVDAIHTQHLQDQVYSGESNKPQTPYQPNVAVSKFDMEKLKFRLIFMMWPVMVGISMAL